MKYYVDTVFEYVHSDGWKYRASPDPDTDGAYVLFTYYEWDDAKKEYVYRGEAPTIPPEILAHAGIHAHKIASGLRGEEIGE